MRTTTTVGRVMGLLAIGMLAAAPVSAASISVFSGGIHDLVTVVDPAADGSLGDPWIISERMTAEGTLEIDDFPWDNATGSGHAQGRWFQKTVLNDSGAAWTSFELELQIDPGIPSLDGDGLSFAQGAGLLFTSDKFATVTSVEDIRDYLNFHDGIVDDGESVTFMFAITDNFFNDPIFLHQTPDKEEVGDQGGGGGQVPEPSIVLMTGLAGLSLVRRRKQ